MDVFLFSLSLTPLLQSKNPNSAWLLPTEKDRHQDLQATARDHMEMAELLRFACRDRYDDLAAFARLATHTLQKVLCQYQSCEERSVEELAVVLRKQVVFESSCLANEQYEAQVIFKVIEAVDRDRDLEAFIHAHKAPFPGADVSNTLKSLGLSSSSPLPVPPSPFEGTTTHTAPRPSYSSEASAMAVVLEKGDLPNLSSPAPHVVPATTVLRLLRGGLSGSRTPTPPPPLSSSTSPSLRTTNVPPPLFSPSAFMASTSSNNSSSTSSTSSTSSSSTSPLPLVSPATAASSSSSSHTTVPLPSLASLHLSAPTPAAAGAAGAAARAATPPAVPVRMQSPLLVHLGTFVTPKPGLDDSEDEGEEEEEEEEGEEEEEDEDEGFAPPGGKSVRSPLTAAVMAQADARRKGTPSPLLPLEELRTADGGVEYRL